jgi:hypothetical protein
VGSDLIKNGNNFDRSAAATAAATAQLAID